MIKEYNRLKKLYSDYLTIYCALKKMDDRLTIEKFNKIRNEKQ